MLFASSNRALISTRTVTCLPFSAARESAWTKGLSPLVRYSVCLMASTLGSSAASWMKRTTGSNDSYGWCRRMSRDPVVRFIQEAAEDPKVRSEEHTSELQSHSEL